MPFKGQKFTGARARFSIEGIPVGYARSVSGAERVIYEPVKVLDNLQVEEHVAVAYECDLRAQFLRIVGESVKKNDWFPKLGSSTSEHLTNVLTSGEMAVMIEDTKTSQAIQSYEQVKMTSHNWTIDAQGVVGEDVEFVAIRTKDESE